MSDNPYQSFSPRAWVSKTISETKRAIKIWPARGFFALLDQGLISGSNFIVAVLLARWLAPSQYGGYALAFEVFLFLSVVYGALILEPMSVLGPSIYKGQFHSYLGILLRIHSILSVLIIGAVFAGAGTLSALKPGGTLPDALVGVGIASPCLLLFWLARRGFYVHLLPKKAAMGACVYSAILLSGLAAVYYLRALSTLSAFLIMAAGAVVAGPLMLSWFKSHVPASHGRQLRLKEVVRQHWNYGRWALASSVAIWFSAAIYYPLMGSFFSLAGTGEFKALMNLASPVSQVFVAFTLLSLPYASRAYHEQGSAAAGRLAWKLSGVYVLGTSVYWLILLLVRGPVVQHLYGGKYSPIVAVLPWLAVGSIVRIAATAQAIVLRAMRAPSLVFVAYCAACVVSIALGVPATRVYGLRGAVFSWVISSATAFVGAVLIVRYKSNSKSPAGTLAAKALTLREEATFSIRG